MAQANTVFACVFEMSKKMKRLFVFCAVFLALSLCAAAASADDSVLLPGAGKPPWEMGDDNDAESEPTQEPGEGSGSPSADQASAPPTQQAAPTKIPAPAPTPAATAPAASAQPVQPAPRVTAVPATAAPQTIAPTATAAPQTTQEPTEPAPDAGQAPVETPGDGTDRYIRSAVILGLTLMLFVATALYIAGRSRGRRRGR